MSCYCLSCCCFWYYLFSMLLRTLRAKKKTIPFPWMCPPTLSKKKLILMDQLFEIVVQYRCSLLTWKQRNLWKSLSLNVYSGKLRWQQINIGYLICRYVSFSYPGWYREVLLCGWYITPSLLFKNSINL